MPHSGTVLCVLSTKRSRGIPCCALKLLRILRLRAGLTIRGSAERVRICRHTLMKYDSGRTAVKRKVPEKLQLLYHTLLSGIK